MNENEEFFNLLNNVSYSLDSDTLISIENSMILLFSKKNENFYQENLNKLFSTLIDFNLRMKNYLKNEQKIFDLILKTFQNLIKTKQEEENEENKFLEILKKVNNNKN